MTASIALAAAVVAAAAAPPPDADRARDALADRKRDELIRDLQAIIPRMKPTDRRADLEFQLAELWWEKARRASLEEVRRYDETDEAWLRDRKGAEPKIDVGESEGYRKQALRLYQEILDDYPGYERRDEVLFVSAHNLYESGDREQGVRRYQALVEGYPQSRFAPDAWVQMGEHWFNVNDLARARAAYEKAASFRVPKLYPFAVYKLAWCDYNAGAYAQAVAKFQQVIAYAEGETRKDRVQLRSEALRDIVLAYAHLDAVDEAVAYLSDKAGAIDAVERLASTYFDSGKFEESIRVYRVLEARAPGHVRAPAWQQRVLLCWDKLGRRDQVASEMKRLVAQYGPESGWAKANAREQGAVAQANELAESALRELVQDYHQEATKTKDAATYRLARDIYRQYLAAFPRAPAAIRMRFYYAEILYALEQWDEAAAQYGQVADADPAGEYAQRAAYDAVLALEKSVEVAQGKLQKRELADAARVDEGKDKGHVDRRRALQLQKVTRDVRELPVPENERQLIAACDRYVRLAPGAKDEILIRYKAAFLYYEHRHFVEAAKRFGEIILRWPTDAWSQKAANLSLDILDTREEWPALSELAQRFLGNASLCPPGSKFAGEVARIAEGARFKSVMQIYEEKKDFAAAAREFRAFVGRYPKSRHAPKALYDALVIADQAEQLDVEIAAGEQLMRDYPGADAAVLELAVPALASACERVGRYADAIRWYEEAQRRWPRAQHAPDWLYDAAVWREGLGDDAGALAAWRTYLQLYGARPDAATIAFNVGLILERKKDLRAAADHWSAFPRKWSRSASAAELVLARYHQGLALRALHAPEAAAVLADVVARSLRLPQGQRTPALIDAAAHARFLGTEDAFAGFLRVRFTTARQAALVSALKAKNARLQALLAAWAEAIAIGSPAWSEAAFERMGEAYRDFNRGLLQAPIPRGLDEQQQEIYRNTLSAQALPLEDKATEAFRKSVAISQQSGVYSPWVVKAQDLLREYQPDAFGEVRRPRFAEAGLPAVVAPQMGGDR